MCIGELVKLLVGKDKDRGMQCVSASATSSTMTRTNVVVRLTSKLLRKSEIIKPENCTQRKTKEGKRKVRTINKKVLHSTATPAPPNF